MSKTITITSDLEREIVAFCEDELNYHINESGCADEYMEESHAEMELLKLLGYEDLADKFFEDIYEE